MSDSQSSALAEPEQDAAATATGPTSAVLPLPAPDAAPAAGAAPAPVALSPEEVAALAAARRAASAKRKQIAVLALTAIAPALLLTAYDCLRRTEMFTARAGPNIGAYFGGVALSAALWGFGLEAARHPRRFVSVPALVILGLTGAFGVGGQILFHATAHEYFNRDAVLFAINMGAIILDYILQNPVLNFSVIFGFGAVTVGYAVLRRRRVGPRREFPTILAVLGLAACLAATFSPMNSPASRHGLPPEILFWHSAGGAALYAVGLVEKPRTLPPGQHLAPPASGQPLSADTPDIVLIFGESVRRDEVCAQKSESCTKSPRLDAAAPARIGFKNSFAVASCTEVSSAILWTGLPITSTSEAMQTAPLVWDYAKSRGYRTGYLTSQSLSFQDQGTFLRTSQIDEKREARDRVAHADVDLGTPDETSAQETLAFLAKGGGPAFAVLHLSNTHLPYRQVDGYTSNKVVVDHPDPTKLSDTIMDSRHAKYLNSLAFQDGVIGDFVRDLRKTERGKKAIVLYTADHGEAWGEHTSYTHTFDLYGEQINVPFWIDAPEGSLTPAQLAELRTAAAGRPVFTPDVTATVLDLLGALDRPELTASTSKLAGKSVLRPPPPVAHDMELSNCPPFRGCFPESWGLVRWPLKYHFVGRAFESVCFDLEADSTERSPLPPDTCREMRELLNTHYGVRADRSLMPSGSASATPSAGASPSAPPPAPKLQ